MSERGCSSRRMEAKFSFYDIFASLELIPIGDDDQAAARHEELYQREVRDDGTFVHAVCPSCVTIGFHMTGCVLNFWGHDISKDSITTYHPRLTTVTAATTCHLLLGFSNNPIMVCARDIHNGAGVDEPHGEIVGHPHFTGHEGSVILGRREGCYPTGLGAGRGLTLLFLQGLHLKTTPVFLLGGVNFQML